MLNVSPRCTVYHVHPFPEPGLAALAPRWVLETTNELNNRVAVQMRKTTFLEKRNRITKRLLGILCLVH